MKVIDLLNQIANGEIEDKRTFKILYPNKIHRSIYYDDNEPNCLWRLKNVSDDEPIQDDIEFNDEVEIIEEQQDIDIQETKELDIDEENVTKGNIIDAVNDILIWAKQLDKKIKDKE